MAYVNQNFVNLGNLYITADGSSVINVTDFSFDKSRDKQDQQYAGSLISYPIYGVKTVTGSFSSHQIFSNDISINEVGYDWFNDKFDANTSLLFQFKTSKTGSKYQGGTCKIDNISISGTAGSTPNAYSVSLTFSDVSIYTA
jgi:hypothetical protein